MSCIARSKDVVLSMNEILPLDVEGLCGSLKKLRRGGELVSHRGSARLSASLLQKTIRLNAGVSEREIAVYVRLVCGTQLDFHWALMIGLSKLDSMGIWV